MNKQRPKHLDLGHIVTRRKFLGTTALGSAALLSGGFASLVQRSALAAAGFDFVEKSLPELQDAMASGRHTSRSLTDLYLKRIDDTNRKGPTLGAVIETNPDARQIAAVSLPLRGAGDLSP